MANMNHKKKISGVTLNIIVAVAKDGLLGDGNPSGNGLLWHSKEELQYYKERTVGNVTIFGGKTAQVVPIDLMRKTRIVEVLHRGMDIDAILSKYAGSDKQVYICGGASIYKYFLENYEMDNIYISRIKDHIEVAPASEPLYLPDVMEYGYKLVESKDYNDFVAKVYRK